jgi:branched-chain amino acid transport system substrate-binding protein
MRLRPSLWFSLAAVLAAVALAGPARAKDTVKLAFIAPLTGGNSANGLGGRNSADLAVKIHNADPRSKYHYELVVQDDECKPEAGVQVATKVAADKSIIAGVTHYCSVVAMATLDTYHRFGFPAIVWGAVLPDITERGFKEVHRVNGTMVSQNAVAAKFMLAQGYKRWAIIHDTTDYGKGHDKYFSQDLKAGGGQILSDVGVTADQQDFTAELTQAKAANPEVLYFGGLTPLGVRIRAQMEKVGLNAQFQGTSGIVSDDFIKGLGPLAEGVVAFHDGTPAARLPGGKFFLENYAKQGYAQGAEAYGPYAYVAAMLIMDGIDKVGPDRKKLNAELAKVKDRDTIVGKVTFDEKGQNIAPIITKYVVQDGKWVTWEDSEYASGKRKLRHR